MGIDALYTWANLLDPKWSEERFRPVHVEQYYGIAPELIDLAPIRK